ncbi:MAG: SUKH-3 domain-containing protein [Oscillospiraceae bacterium]|nr:SUKH-3 domain-containing protein [Oscillospiraceae bacterium]
MGTIIPLNGPVRERIMTCLKAAGWYPGRAVDLTEVNAFYASGGIHLPAGAEAFLREYYGIAESWYLKETEEELRRLKLAVCAPEVEFSLYPYRGLPDCNREYWYHDPEALEEQRRVETEAGEPMVFVGCIGYYYSANVYLGSTAKIYTAHDYDEIVHCYDSVPEMLEYDFINARGQMRAWNFALMKMIDYEVNDPRNVID